MQISIRITSANTKWTCFRYLSSNAKSRIPTSQLLELIEDGKIKAVNPHMINEVNEA